MVRYCPRCDLRFVAEPELREHLVVDHALDPEALERNRYPTNSSKPLYSSPAAPSGALDGVSTRRFLVVANQTLGGERLAEAIRSRVAAGPCSFSVLVPATHSADYRAELAQGRLSASTRADEKGLAQARWRLRQAIDRLRDEGVEATGEIGGPDPFEAVRELLRREEFDEIILSTLPAGMSRWLGMDLPQRLQRRFRLPVTTVVAER